jgi:hypothetical protein
VLPSAIVSPRLLAAALLAAAACGGDTVEPLLGVWQVGSHTVSTTGCAAEGPPVADPPYVQFQTSDVEGRPVLELVDCAAPASCDASGGLAGRLYTRVIPGGRRAEVFAAFGEPGNCALGARRSDAVIAADGTLRVETRSYEERGVSGVVCDEATAERLLTSLPCLELDVLVATHTGT